MPMVGNGGSQEEFRENSRAPLEAPAEVQLDAFSRPLTGQTANISLGGLFLKLKDPPPVGSVVRFKVELGFPAGTVRGTGEVVWIRAHSQGTDRPAGIGVQFRFVEEDAAPLLRTAVQLALEKAGPLPEEPPKRPPRPRPPRPRPVASQSEHSSARRGRPTGDKKSQSQARPRNRSTSQKSTDGEKQILGLPPEKAKLILLAVLFGVLFLIILL